LSGEMTNKSGGLFECKTGGRGARSIFTAFKS